MLYGLAVIIVMAVSTGYLWHWIVTRPHFCEGSAVVADARMLAGASDDRQIADMIGIAKSQAVIDDITETLQRKAGVAGARRILSTLRAQRIGNSDLVRITVRAGTAANASIASEVLATAFVHRWESLGRGAGVMKIVEPKELRGIDTIGKLGTTFLISWPILMILTGLEIGYLLGFITAKRARGQSP